MGQRKIYLNRVYITKDNKEFTPIQRIEGKILSSEHQDNPYPTRKQAKFVDINGNIKLKTNLLKLKDEI